MKTKAAVLRNIGGPLIIEELEVPKLGRGQVLVKILYSGLCRSQINEINGRKGAEFIPHLLGHEASGIVLEIGKDVKKVRTGDFVVVSWIAGMGLPTVSVKYQSVNGTVNAGAVATFCQYAVIAENHLVKITSIVDANVAALLGCAIPTGAGMIDSHKMNYRHELAIFGIGGIGAGALIRAASQKVNCVAFDVNLQKLQWVWQLPYVHVKARFFNDASKYFGTFDFAIECSGKKQAMTAAFECLKNNGTAIIAGNLEPGGTITIDPFELIKGKKLKGTWGGECFLDRDIPRYVDEYLAGTFPLDQLTTKIYAFDEINEGLRDLEEGKLIRGLIKIP